MSGLLNFGLIDQALPVKVGNSFNDGYQNALARQRDQQDREQRNALAQMQMETHRMGLDESRRKLADDTSWREALRGAGPDIEGALPKLMQANPEKAMALQSSLAKQRADRIKMAKDAVDLQKSLATEVFANPSMENAAAKIAQYGQMTGMDVSAQLAELQALGGDPAAIRKWAGGKALEAAKLLPKFEQFDQGGAVMMGTVDPLTGAFTQSGAVRKSMTPGEGARLAQSDRHFNIQQNTPSIQNVEGVGVFSVPKNGGPAVPVTAAGGVPLKSEKPLTEFQGKATGYGMRAMAAHDVLNKVGNDGDVQPGLIKRVAEATPFVGESMGTLTNWTQSGAQQKVEQAQRDFINAVLRQESGAVISDTEFANARKQYFPQPGDTPDVISQKKANRENAIRAFAVQAGPGAKSMGGDIFAEADRILNGGK